MMNLIGKIKRKRRKKQGIKRRKKGFFFLLYKEERIKYKKIEKNNFPKRCKYSK